MASDSPDRRRATRPDPLTPEQRRLNMSRIRAKNTKPELVLRRALHARGLRYRLHDRSLPGSPDMVFAGGRAVVFVHGCFWHGHDCPRGVTPGTRTEFWKAKIGGNRDRDMRARAALRDAGWRVLEVWECALTGPERRPLAEVAEMVRVWLSAGRPEGEIRGAARRTG